MLEFFKGLTRDEKPITKTFGGDIEALMETVLVPPTNEEISGVDADGCGAPVAPHDGSKCGNLFS